MRFTAASDTPGCFAKLRWTRAWHAAHVIPLTGMRMCSRRVDAISFDSAALDAKDCAYEGLGRIERELQPDFRNQPVGRAIIFAEDCGMSGNGGRVGSNEHIGHKRAGLRCNHERGNRSAAECVMSPASSRR